jgi:Fe-S-cluster-containing dehydrogenase component
MKVMLIDYAVCNGCYNCQIACKDEHCGNDWTPIAKPQRRQGHFWHMVTSEERGTYPG